MDCVVDRTRRALALAREMVAEGMPLQALVVAGGVAANQAMRGALQGLAQSSDLRFVAPPLALCTDNAAMIAWAGYENWAAGLKGEAGDDLSVPARPRWPLDPQAAPVRGAGVKA